MVSSLLPKALAAQGTGFVTVDRSLLFVLSMLNPHNRLEVLAVLLLGGHEESPTLFTNATVPTNIEVNFFQSEIDRLANFQRSRGNTQSG
jgi:hypothetical protein